MEIPKTFFVNEPLEVMGIMVSTLEGRGVDPRKTCPQGFTENKGEPGKPPWPTRK